MFVSFAEAQIQADCSCAGMLGSNRDPSLTRVMRLWFWFGVTDAAEILLSVYGGGALISTLPYRKRKLLCCQHHVSVILKVAPNTKEENDDENRCEEKIKQKKRFIGFFLFFEKSKL